MNNSANKMKKFDFLLGTWSLAYKVPKSAFSEAMTGSGSGIFQRTLNDRYVYFDYSSVFKSGSAKAHAVFAWDEKAQLYRYYWFEDSGNFLTAACNFVNDDILLLNWHDTLLIQTFTKLENSQVILKMEHPNSNGKYESILEVLFTRRNEK